MEISQARRDEETRLLIEYVRTGWQSSLDRARVMIAEDDR